MPLGLQFLLSKRLIIVISSKSYKNSVLGPCEVGCNFDCFAKTGTIASVLGPCEVGTAYPCHQLWRKGVPPTKLSRPSSSWIRSTSFHFTIRSERWNEPTFSCPAPSPTDKWLIKLSSVSPERAETMLCQPAWRAVI